VFQGGIQKLLIPPHESPVHSLTIPLPHTQRIQKLDRITITGTASSHHPACPCPSCRKVLWSW
jgi:hypothetical protein